MQWIWGIALLFSSCSLTAFGRLHIEPQSEIRLELSSEDLQMLAEGERQRERIQTALSEGGDLSQLSDQDISSALLRERQNRSFQGRRGEDVGEFETNISRLEAEKIRRQGGPPVNIASATNRPRPTESFVTVEGAIEIFERTGRWPTNMSVWDLGQRFGRDPNQYLTNLDGPKPRPPAPPPTLPEPLERRGSQFFSVRAPADRSYNNPLVPDGDRILSTQSLIPNPSNTVVAVARPDTDFNGAIRGQAEIFRRTGAQMSTLGLSADRNGNPDPVGDLIGLVRNQHQHNGGQPVDVNLAGHGERDSIRLAPGPNGTLDRSSVARLNRETTGMLGNFTITACDVSGGVCPGQPSLAGDIRANRVISFTSPVMTNSNRYDLPGAGTVDIPTVLSTQGNMVEVINYKGLGGRAFRRTREYTLY